jgi:4-amino-4-deoxy-L-arabinose transferase-like glycosyltransferase
MPTDPTPRARFATVRVHPALVVLVVAALTCLAGLGRPAITDSDEAFYAEAAREMVESGDWLTPRYNYADRWQKPVLYYWGAALGYEVAGVGEAAARLPSALSGIGLAVLAWAVGRRWYGERAGRLAGVVLGTSVGLVTIARLALPDLPLAFFISLGTWTAMRAALDGDRLDARWLVASAGALGAGFLMKGPVALAVPLVVLVPLVTIERRWRVVLRPGPLALALLAFLVVGVPWYWAMYRAHGVAYLQSFFVGDNLERFATDRFNDPRPPWFYLPVVVAGMLPWSAFFALWAAPAWRVLRRKARLAVPDLRLILWAVLPVLLFTASVGKQPRYILPALLPLAVGLAASIDARLRAGAPGRTWTAAAVLAGVVVAAFGGILLQVPAELVGTETWRLVAGGLVVLLLGLAAIVVAVRRPPRLPATLAAASVALFVALHLSVLGPSGPETVEQVAARLAPLLGPGVQWTTREVFVRNLVFYVGKAQSGPFEEPGLVDFLKSPGPVLALVPDKDVERLGAAAGVRLHRIDEWRYFNIAAVRWRHLFTRTPGRAFRTVVLVSNRDMIRR